MWGKVRETEIWREGRYILAKGKLRPEIYEFETDWEGAIPTRGDWIELNYDAPVFGLGSATIMKVDNATSTAKLYLSNVLEFDVGAPSKQYALRVRTIYPDGHAQDGQLQVFTV